jgi:hypothetical protein
MMQRVQNLLSPTQVQSTDSLAQARGIETQANSNLAFGASFAGAGNVANELPTTPTTPTTPRKIPMFNLEFSPEKSPNSGQQASFIRLKAAFEAEKTSPKTAARNLLQAFEREKAGLEMTTSEQFLVGQKIAKKLEKRYTNAEAMASISGVFAKSPVGASSNAVNSYCEHSEEFKNLPLTHATKKVWIDAENHKTLHGPLDTPANKAAHIVSVVGGRDTIVNVVAGVQHYYKDGEAKKTFAQSTAHHHF